MLKLVRTDNDELYINDGEIILAGWIADSHHEKVIVRDVYGGLIAESKLPIETDQGERTEASDVINDIGCNFKNRGFPNYYQWVMRCGDLGIYSKEGLWYIPNGGTAGADADLQVKDIPVGTFDGVGIFVSIAQNIDVYNHTAIFDFKKTNTLQSGSLYSIGNTLDITPYYLVGLNVNGKIVMQLRDDSGFVATYESSLSYNDNIWYRIKCKIVNKAVVVTIDGNEVINETLLQSTITTNNLTLGALIRTSTASLFDGQMSFAQISNADVSPDNIDCLFATHFQANQGVTVFNEAQDGSLPDSVMSGGLVSTFRGSTSDYAQPVLNEKGGERYESDTTPGDYIYVIANADGTYKTPTISGYTKVDEYPPQCVWPTPYTYKQPSGDAGLFALSKAYPSLDFMYGADEDTPLEFDWDDLDAIDIEGDSIPVSDFVITKKDTGCFCNMASQPYENYQTTEGILPYKVIEGNIQVLKF